MTWPCGSLASRGRACLAGMRLLVFVMNHEGFVWGHPKDPVTEEGALPMPK